MDAPDRLPVPLPPSAPRSGMGARVVDLVRRRPIVATAAATVVLSAIFLAFPDIDLAVAGLFHVEGRGFPIERMRLPIALREAGLGLTRWLTIALVAAVLAKMLLPMLARAIPTRPLAFLVASLALGPGLLVNAGLKAFWGRPRPREIIDFGGAFDFFPAWVPGGSCAGNCSFPSGEASSAVWLLALVFVVPARRRRPVAIAAVAWTLAISLNRIAFGGHFLSDVIVAWGLVTLVTLLTREAILIRCPDRALAALDDGLARIGAAILRSPARLVDRWTELRSRLR